MRDQFGIWHVCYSMHSSKEELEWALRLLAPKWVISTTPECRAIELDYVKKNCSYGKLTNDDPLSKLMDINFDAPLMTKDVFVKEDLCCLSVVETKTNKELQVQPLNKIPVSKREHLNFSPPSKGGPLTLFGRARLRHQDSTFSYEKTEIPPNVTEGEYEKAEIPLKVPIDDCPLYAVLAQSEKVIEGAQSEKVIEGGCERSLEKKIGVDFIEEK